jgi:2'-5' RNA ligase
VHNVYKSEQLRNAHHKQLIELHMILKRASEMYASFSLRCVSLSLFPPEKKNLVIAQYGPSEESLRMFSETCDQIEYLGFTKIHELNKLWLPHVTLGKICGTKKQLEILESDLSETLATLYSKFDQCNNFKPEGLRLCGYVPKKPWLNWTEEVLTFLPLGCQLK